MFINRTIRQIETFIPTSSTHSTTHSHEHTHTQYDTAQTPPLLDLCNSTRPHTHTLNTFSTHSTYSKHRIHTYTFQFVATWLHLQLLVAPSCPVCVTRSALLPHTGKDDAMRRDDTTRRGIRNPLQLQPFWGCCRPSFLGLGVPSRDMGCVLVDGPPFMVCVVWAVLAFFLEIDVLSWSVGHPYWDWDGCSFFWSGLGLPGVRLGFSCLTSGLSVCLCLHVSVCVFARAANSRKGQTPRRKGQTLPKKSEKEGPTP